MTATEDRTGVVARLDALEAAHKAATPGPWATYEALGHDGNECPWHLIGIRSMTGLLPEVAQTAPLDMDDNPQAAADAAAIVAEHNAFGDLLAVVRGVLESHVPSHAYCVVCDKDRDVEALGNAFPCDHYASFCRECDFAWPCRTVSSVAAALGEA